MNVPITTKGQSLVEILFAIAVFTVGVIAVGYLIFDAFFTMRYGIESLQARLFAYEAVEAVASMLEVDFDTAEQGTYGVVLQNGVWSLVSGTTTWGKFDRTVAIVDVDESTKRVTATVTWDVLQNNQKEVVATASYTDWRQTKGDMPDLSIDIHNADVIASGTILYGIALRNIGDQSLRITHMRVQTDPVTTITGIGVNGEEIFSASSTQGVPSGDLIDIDDYDIGAATGYHLFDHITFEDSVAGSNFVVSFVLSNGTTKHVYVSF